MLISNTIIFFQWLFTIVVDAEYQIPVYTRLRFFLSFIHDLNTQSIFVVYSEERRIYVTFCNQR